MYPSPKSGYCIDKYGPTWTKLGLHQPASYREPVGLHQPARYRESDFAGATCPCVNQHHEKGTYVLLYISEKGIEIVPKCQDKNTLDTENVECYPDQIYLMNQ